MKLDSLIYSLADSNNLKTIKSLLESAATAADFAAALTAAYPNLPGADGVPALAEAMYK